MSAQAITDNRTSFMDAVRDQSPVKGFTHNLYKYPARFSPAFARSAIEQFTVPGGTVLDPFVGGGTTMVEARLAGRNAFGSDISSLAVFLTRTKSIALSNADLRTVERWFSKISQRLNIHQAVENQRAEEFESYDRNMPWRLRKLCEQYVACVSDLPTHGQQRFARCVLLRCGQWAMDCRKEIPSVAEFRSMLNEKCAELISAMQEYRFALTKSRKKQDESTVFRCVQKSAAELRPESFGGSFPGKADLILTSPPYPGVHVLYHRWNVRGRRETPAPFWLANCLDGRGDVHYTLGDRRQEKLKNYFAGIEKSFLNLRDLLADKGLVIQMVAFSSPEWQLSAYLRAMRDAGYREVMPSAVGVDCADRLWRAVPGRRWYSVMRGNIASSYEVVLFHRKRS